MSDLLDKHSEDYDPDAFAGLVDDQRKADKESGRVRVSKERVRSLSVDDLGLDPPDAEHGRAEHLAEGRSVEQHQEEKYARRRALDPDAWPCELCGHGHRPGAECSCGCRA